MKRPVCALVLLLLVSGGFIAACGTVKDEGLVCMEEGDSSCGRPLDLEYMTAAIFAPSCGQAQCHSKFHQAGNLVFDNPDDAARSLLAPDSGPLLQFSADSQYDPANPSRALLIRWLTEIDPLERGIGRMPFDAPLPNRDIELLEIWIRAGKPSLAGGLATGAQCDPDLYGGLACFDSELVQCGDDFNFGETVESCTKGCQITDCLEVVDGVCTMPVKPPVARCVP